MKIVSNFTLIPTRVVQRIVYLEVWVVRFHARIMMNEAITNLVAGRPLDLTGPDLILDQLELLQLTFVFRLKFLPDFVQRSSGSIREGLLPKWGCSLGC